LFGGKFQRVSSHLVFLSSLLGGLILAPQGGITLAQPTKRPRPKQESARKGLFIWLLNAAEMLDLRVIFF
jgi:hypothetical protein